MHGAVERVASQVKTDGGGDLDRMRAAMAELERVQKTLKEDLADRDAEMAELRSEIAAKDSEIDELEGALARAESGMDELEEHTDTLARLHTKIKRGAIDDALYDLEKVLSHLDSAWGTRA